MSHNTFLVATIVISLLAGVAVIYRVYFRRRFTLIEHMVTIGTLAIAAGVIVPKFVELEGISEEARRRSEEYETRRASILATEYARLTETARSLTLTSAPPTATSTATPAPTLTSTPTQTLTPTITPKPTRRNRQPDPPPPTCVVSPNNPNCKP